ncbi:hypothetical protein Tco_0797150 [Tanacetum coccineum]
MRGSLEQQLGTFQETSEIDIMEWKKTKEIWESNMIGDLLHKDLEQIDDVNIEEIDINWQKAECYSNEEILQED